MIAEKKLRKSAFCFPKKTESVRNTPWNSCSPSCRLSSNTCASPLPLLVDFSNCSAILVFPASMYRRSAFVDGARFPISTDTMHIALHVYYRYYIYHVYCRYYIYHVYYRYYIYHVYYRYYFCRVQVPMLRGQLQRGKSNLLMPTSVEVRHAISLWTISWLVVGTHHSHTAYLQAGSRLAACNWPLPLHHSFSLVSCPSFLGLM